MTDGIDRNSGFWEGFGFKPDLTKPDLNPDSAIPKMGERPPVELSAEERHRVGTRAAEFQEWVAGGLTRQEALMIIGTEIQVQMNLDHQDRIRRERDGG